MDIIKGISSIVLSFLMILGLWAPESLEIGNVPTKNEGEVRVISFNVRCKDDLYGSVKTRSELIASALKQYAPDSFGVQEATEEWMNILSEKLGEAYGFVGVPRDDSKNTEYSAVFYLKDKYELSDSGTMWLSGTPDVAGSKVKASSMPRIATWAVLKDKATGKTYTHINTHLDHLLEIARVEQAEILTQKIAELKKYGAVVCTGDFNSKEGNDAYCRMTEVLSDSKYLAKESDNGLTFGNYGTNIFDRKPIDFIFVSEGTEVSRYKIIDEQIAGMYLSDHYGVCADIKI